MEFQFNPDTKEIDVNTVEYLLKIRSGPEQSGSLCSINLRREIVRAEMFQYLNTRSAARFHWILTTF